MKYKKYTLRLLKSIFSDNQYMVLRAYVIVMSRRLLLTSRTVIRAILKIATPVKELERKAYDLSRTKNHVGNNIGDLSSLELPLSSVKNNGLTIIILNRNGSNFLDELFQSLVHLPKVQVELIFVDHNSSDESITIFNKYDNANKHIDFILIAKEVNDSFSKSNNQAVNMSRYENILFLNNDVIINSNTELYTALSVLNNIDEVGIIGWDLYYDNLCLYPQHQGISFEWSDDINFFRPINLVNEKITRIGYGKIRKYAAVTLAIALCRKSDYIKVGGFDEDFNYGYEDVDLCLSIKSKLNKAAVIITGLSAQHKESISQSKDKKKDVVLRRMSNAIHLNSKFGYYIRVHKRKKLLSSSTELNIYKQTIGFVVTEAFEGATAGDYFTALELSISLQKVFGYAVRFLPQRGVGSSRAFDCADLDILVVMIDRFDLRKIVNYSPTMITVAWMRNWFDRWASWDWFRDYDVHFVTSKFAKEHFHQKHKLSTEVLRIASNHKRFYATIDDKFRDIDICFAGSSWNVKRDVETVFHVMDKYNSRVYGSGWSKSESIGNLNYGAINYERLPGIYSRTKIVVDDAASSTQQWNSLNSRVYDAIVSGCLVISNSDGACNEFTLINDKKIEIPTFSAPREFELLINKYLNNDQLRTDIVRKNQLHLLKDHTYDIRANQFKKLVHNHIKKQLKYSIKVPVPSEKVKQQWGDYHFAESLRKELTALGHSVRIDLLPEWYDIKSYGDDVVIVLRGLSEYKPRSNQINIMWHISHPDKVSKHEFELYDIVYVASKKYAAKLKNKKSNTIFKPLLQCTDVTRFHQDISDKIPTYELLFVGNSRNVYRNVVKYSVENNLLITVYGGLWEQYIDSSIIESQNLSNDILRKHYSNAKIVLNDHWDSMREFGFISNRIFDAVSCGAIVVSDNIEGLFEIFGENVVIYDGTEENFLEAIKFSQSCKVDKKIIASVQEKHSFSERAKTIDVDVTKLHKQIMGHEFISIS